ncbi:hypothetical protein MELA_02483 [Candidatus Methylomirabilis lanthanidiphila]|uniref:Uncharacterized protein n=1 Tax=Candidatus Methylomirabilis lanthanidiphila TaxID=2211376 RepID=A0A564ZNH0_9BACT|nr:hypothetical protein MELA_02483 [Candidatus Methylomirabilis lanthanidiphila]
MENLTVSHLATAASQGTSPAGQKIIALISRKRSGPIDSIVIHFNRAGSAPLVMPNSTATPRALIQVILQMPGFGPHAQFLLRALLDLSDSLPRECESLTDLFQSHRIFFPQPEA